MAAVVVVETMVTEAMSQREAGVAGGAVGVQSSTPYPRRRTSLPWRPTATATPGEAESATARIKRESTVARSPGSMPTEDGSTSAGEATTPPMLRHPSTQVASSRRRAQSAAAPSRVVS